MSTAKILIVEDESIIALDIQTSLQNAGYQVVSIATTAEEALSDITHLQPDLVLMDVRLSGEMDGVETAEKIRKNWQLPVVFLTAHADEPTLARAKNVQPFGYILKPFEDRELVTAVEIALSRHKAERMIQSALKKEKEISELKSRFVSVVSHEFRNPLNTILFSTELLQRYGTQITEQKKATYLERIQDSVKRMHQLLTDVLTVGETEAGKLQFIPQSLDLIRFCKELVDEFHLTDKRKSSIAFSYNETNGSHSRLDERLLRHILTNLLSNAVKYSPSGELIDFRLELSDRSAVFQIRDRGIGIPKSEQTDLFQSFHRASNAKSIPGTGLGLSIVKQCVDLHGGTITVESEENQGTLVTVTLPINRQSTYENDPRD
ncbi:response regulator [Cyanobacteria bacterium FACHB-DQ100]|uniref:hybrid sensor histidine kinase/response regulator n=1 Tax=Leptolyngbya sp. DQ-M1 TaxID=2933920 RepID=UPI001998DFE8|nr:response regulator [Cyanobacteria bacterium FACHB-DQ100]